MLTSWTRPRYHCARLDPVSALHHEIIWPHILYKSEYSLQGSLKQSTWWEFDFGAIIFQMWHLSSQLGKTALARPRWRCPPASRMDGMWCLQPSVLIAESPQQEPRRRQRDSLAQKGQLNWTFSYNVAAQKRISIYSAGFGIWNLAWTAWRVGLRTMWLPGLKGETHTDKGSAAFWSLNSTVINID